MQQEHSLDNKKIFILVLSIILLFIGIYFSFNSFDENGNVKEISILLASCSIGFSLKNIFALKKEYYKE